MMNTNKGGQKYFWYWIHG